MRVLITGAAGCVGRQLTAALQDDHELRLGDIAPPADDRRFVTLDVTRPDQVEAAVAGVDAVVHLAIASGYEGDYEDVAFNQLRFDVNVKGTHNVVAAACRAGVRRFVFASSLMVVWGYPPPEWVESDAPPRPVGTYALTKQLGEVICRHAHREHGLSVICLRMPKPIDLDEPAWKRRPLRPPWIAFPDLMQAYRRALAAPDIGYEIVTVVGESSKRRWDLSKAERVLGYRPEYPLEKLGYEIGDESEPLTND